MSPTLSATTPTTKSKTRSEMNRTKDIRESLATSQQGWLKTNCERPRLARMEGASSYLTTLPLTNENYSFNKREFHDTIRMRYRWQLKYLPTSAYVEKPSLQFVIKLEKPPRLPFTGERLHGTR